MWIFLFLLLSRHTLHNKPCTTKLKKFKQFFLKCYTKLKCRATNPQKIELYNCVLYCTVGNKYQKCWLSFMIVLHSCSIAVNCSLKLGSCFAVSMTQMAVRHLYAVVDLFQVLVVCAAK